MQLEDASSALSGDLAEFTSDIVAAYVSHNSVQAASLPELITSVHAALAGLGKASAPTEPETAKATTAEIRKSIRPDGLVSFIDGKSYKTLKRHLTRHGLTGAEYRAKYGLPQDYPMVASSYAAQRSALAKSLGLGQQRKGKTKAAAKAAEAPAPKRRGRPKKTQD